MSQRTPYDRDAMKIDAPDAKHRATSVETFPHAYFSGWHHGAWADQDGVCLARTTSAYPTRADALRAAADAFAKAREG